MAATPARAQPMAVILVLSNTVGRLVPIHKVSAVRSIKLSVPRKAATLVATVALSTIKLLVVVARPKGDRLARNQLGAERLTTDTQFAASARGIRSGVIPSLAR